MSMRVATVLTLSCCLAAFADCAREYFQETVDSRVVNVANVDDGECQVCVWGIRIAEDVLGDPVITATAADKLSQAICKEVQENDKDSCFEYVQIFFPVLVGYLEGAYHEAVPQLMCSAECAGGVPKGLMLHKPVNKVNGAMECAFCEYAVKAMQQALEDDAERAKVMDDARAACKELPMSLQDVCIQYVIQNGPLIIVLLESEEPENVCTLLNACTDNSVKPPLPAEAVEVTTKLAALMVPAFRSQPLQSALFVGDQSCEFCKVAVMELHDKLEEPAFQHAITKYAKRVCDRFGKEFAGQCAQMVDQYAPLVFSMLEDELKPTEFCTMIHMCAPLNLVA